MQRYSFTGVGTVLLRAATKGKYGSNIYEANEPIAYFTDVSINISFSNIEKIARQGVSSLAGYTEYETSVLSISNIKTNESLQSLLYSKRKDVPVVKTEVKKLNSTGGVIYLPVETGDVLGDSVFVYNSNKVKETGYTLDKDNAIINGLSDGQYTVFYSINKTAKSVFSLEDPQSPHIMAEVIINGNIDGQNGYAAVNLGRLKLITKPSLDFNTDLPFSDSLDFAILSDKVPVEISYYG